MANSNSDQGSGGNFDRFMAHNVNPVYAVASAVRMQVAGLLCLLFRCRIVVGLSPSPCLSVQWPNMQRLEMP
jgi:hypothetical protein